MHVQRIDIDREALLRALDDLGWNKTQVARVFNVSRGCILSNVRRLGIERSQKVIEAVAVERVASITDDERRRLRAENAELKAALEIALDVQRRADDIRQAAFGLAQSKLTPPPWVIPKQGKSREGKVETPVLFTSDFQFGEVVKSEEVDGLNEYNPAIARRRYKTLINKAIELCMVHTAHPKYKGIVLFRGGDTVSGSIHEELTRTDAATPPACVRQCAEMEIAGINMLLEAFGSVHVVSVAGNHGRTTSRPQSKGYTDLSYDDLISWAIELHFRAAGLDSVTFHTPRSGDALLKIAGYDFLLTHGDRVGASGGTGFIGPAATIAKGIYKLRKQFNEVRQRIDYVCMGHFHTPMVLEHGLVNGSLAGFDEYAGKKLRVEPHPPSQWLIHVHPDVGVTQYRKIIVDELGSYQAS